jgi:hypothetical protein
VDSAAVQRARAVHHTGEIDADEASLLVKQLKREDPFRLGRAVLNRLLRKGVSGQHRRANELPDRLTPLVRRNSVELYNAHFQRDAETLIEKVRNSLRGERAGPVRWPMTLIGALLAGCIGISQMYMPVRVPLTGGVVVEAASRFDGTWRIDRMGCPPRPELNFQIHVENGNVGGRFEPREMSAIPGSRHLSWAQYPPPAKSTSATPV